MAYDAPLSIFGTAVSIVAGAASWLKWFLPWWQSYRQKKSLISGLRTLHQVYTKMARMREFGAERVVVFGGHNSGGIPRAGSPFYATALHWMVPPGRSSDLADYNELVVDSVYIGMLVSLMERGSYHFNVDTAKDCLLKSYYAMEGIKDSVIFYLACVDNTLLYLSCASYERKFTDNEVTSMHLIAQSISTDIRA